MSELWAWFAVTPMMWALTCSVLLTMLAVGLVVVETWRGQR